MTNDKAIEILTKTCELVLNQLNVIKDKINNGTVPEKLAKLRQMGEPNGEIYNLQEKLLEALTITHWEARSGNFNIGAKGPVVAIGHLTMAQEYLKQYVENSVSLNNCSKAKEHLREALQAIN